MKSLRLSVQTRNSIDYSHPLEGLQRLKKAGFSCVDFSLNDFMKYEDIRNSVMNPLFEKDVEELKAYFLPIREAAKQAGVEVFQMHMPYPIYVEKAAPDMDRFLREDVAPKSLQICAFFGCKYIVTHGFKMAQILGSEEKEWAETEAFLETLAPLAASLGVTICIENLYDRKDGVLIEGPCCRAELSAERIDRMNDKYGTEVLGFCFDIGHANIVGLNYEDFLSVLGPRVKVLHIHDNDGLADLHEIPFTLMNHNGKRRVVDWNAFIRGLKGIGFEGVLNFETGPSLASVPEVLKGRALSFIAEVGSYLSDEILAGNEPDHEGGKISD